MLQQISVDELCKNYVDSLTLHWVAGQLGGERLIHLQSDYKLANIGYLNPIHPHQIQIVGIYEFAYLDALSTEERKNTLDRLFESQNLACMIVVDMYEIPQHLIDYANLFNIPLFTSQISGEHIINHLHTAFARMVAPRITLHGVFMDVLGMGVLIMGESGTGKSELALELVSRGHRLIADDAPEFSRIAPQILSGTSPFPEMNAFLEVRGLGILNVQALYGDSAIKKDKFLRLIIHLQHMSPERMKTIDRLQGDFQMRNILEVNIPEIFLPVAPGRNLAVLLETAVRNHSLKIAGYNAADDFCTRQHLLMAIDD
jgi:HPr kinase/phosphorylase